MTALCNLIVLEATVPLCIQVERFSQHLPGPLLSEDKDRRQDLDLNRIKHSLYKFYIFLNSQQGNIKA